jgi:hypothetical protein
VLGSTAKSYACALWCRAVDPYVDTDGVAMSGHGAGGKQGIPGLP